MSPAPSNNAYMLRQLFVMVLAVQSAGCYQEWNWPKASPKRRKQELCIKIVNGRFLYVDDCKFWSHVTSSDGQAILPP